MSNPEPIAANPDLNLRHVAARPAQDPPASLGAGALAQSLRAAARHMHGALDGLEPARDREPLRVAVVLPCHNEAASIARVVREFRVALPQARIVVFDNASSDDTARVASEAGAEVCFEPRAGKGNVVRRMFADVDADVYLMADGDGTYDASAAPQLVASIAQDNVDMAIGARAMVMQDAHRRGHAFGNRLFNRLYHALFGPDFEDIFSGYRAFSRRFVKSFPALSSGFEIETELSVHASQLKLPTSEVVLPYGKREEGSASKLRTFRDGLRILSTFALLLKETRPALVLWIAGGGRHGARDRAGDPDLCDLRRNRPRSAHADGRSLHRSDAACGNAGLLRTDPRQPCKGAGRTKAHSLSDDRSAEAVTPPHRATFVEGDAAPVAIC